MTFLERIESPADLKNLAQEDLPKLAEELRAKILEVVAQTGGHLGSPLGTVELTIALHRVFHAPKDKLVWDVGHQAYPHKILTGRRDRFHTLRQFEGISGFLRRVESPYDTFGAGHAGTSISAALGMVEARDLKGERNKVVAIIGDGSMTAGLAYEGLNQAGALGKDLIVVLNDNEMSISKNVGALSAYLNRLMTGQFVTRVRQEAGHALKSIPRIGDSMVHLARKAEESLKSFIVPGVLFEELGFLYVGPINGHEIDHLIATFENVKRMNRPVLVHVLTQKGKGYAPAERDAGNLHGMSPFVIETGEAKSRSAVASFTKVFAETLIDLAKADSRIVAVTAAMAEGTGLVKFAKEFPDRFFDVGIAEQHAVTFSAGLAAGGLRPFAVIYSTFLQRAYDQVLYDVCFRNLPVVFCMDRAGLVGDDGPTHHGVFDYAYLRHMPNMVLMAPKDENEMRHMLRTALSLDGPSAIRYPRGDVYGVPMDATLSPIPIGRAEILREGNDVALLAAGSMVFPALAAAELLSRDGIEATVVNARFVKPLDTAVLDHLKDVPRWVTIEENGLEGGFGSAVLEYLAESGCTNVSVRRLGIPDQFIEHGNAKILKARLGLDPEGIRRAVSAFLDRTPSAV